MFIWAARVKQSFKQHERILPLKCPLCVLSILSNIDVTVNVKQSYNNHETIIDMMIGETTIDVMIGEVTTNKMIDETVIGKMIEEIITETLIGQIMEETIREQRYRTRSESRKNPRNYYRDNSRERFK